MPTSRLPTVLLAALLISCGRTPSSASNATSATLTPAAQASAAARVAIGPDADKADVSSIVGRKAPSFEVGSWLDGTPRKVEDLRGTVVLVRWFMSSDCPYCNATAPALVELDATYAKQGLSVIGMYHHKSDGPLLVDDVKALVKDHYRFRFPVAIDDGWKTLRHWWLDDHPDSWTSVSFLIDRAGTVRFVHLGGEYAPDSADYRQMKAWVELLLAEPES